jgi:hypothetical protein
VEDAAASAGVAEAVGVVLVEAVAMAEVEEGVTSAALRAAASVAISVLDLQMKAEADAAGRIAVNASAATGGVDAVMIRIRGA